MIFSEVEQRFLGGGHNGPIEKRSSGLPALPQGMPPHMFQRALEARAKLLGKSFTEFRNRQQNFVRETAAAIAQNVADLF